MTGLTPNSSTSNDPSSGGVTRSALWLTLAATFLGWMFDGMEMGIYPLITRPALQEMLAEANDQLIGLWMGRMTAGFLLGAAFGGIVFGWLGDKIGRVKAMGLSILAYSVFTGVCYFATDPWQLCAMRFVAAIGMGGEWSLGVALVMETWPAKYRPWLAGAIGAASNVGFLLIGVLGFHLPITTDSWRWVMVVGASPAIIALLIIWVIPESKSWQHTAHKESQPLREVFSRALIGRMIAAIVVASIALIGTWGSVQWIPLWADKLTGGSVPEAKAMAGILIAAGAIAGGFIGSLAGSFGRRPAFAFLCLVSLGLCAWLFRGVSEYGLTFNLLTLGVGAFTGAFYGWLPLYLPELFPTRVRATAQGIGFNAGRVLAAIGALGAGELMQYYDGNYARMGAAITLVYVLGVVCIWFAPETKGRPLPE